MLFLKIMPQLLKATYVYFARGIGAMYESNNKPLFLFFFFFFSFFFFLRSVPNRTTASVAILRRHMKTEKRVCTKLMRS
jgi:hypothetical protein